MHALYLCEKPSQARDLASVLGCTERASGRLQCRSGQTVVTWAIGHLLEQKMPDDYDPELKKWQLASLPIVPSSWQYKVRPGVHDQYRQVMALIKQCQQQQATLYLATDFDREGEAIGRELLTRARYRGPLQRIKLTALDRTSIERALAKPVPEQESLPLYWAAVARQKADWLVGMNFSRLFTLFAQQLGLKETYHVGRVSVPTIALVVERDRSIANFVPKDYSELWLNLDSGQGHLRAKWQVPELLADEQGRCQQRSQAALLAEKLVGQSANLSKLTQSIDRQPAPLPLDLTSLQRWADQRLGLSAEQSLKMAQKLYDAKLISYPRTECRYLPQSQWPDTQQVLQALKQSLPSLVDAIDKADLSNKPACFNDQKMAGHSHHGIIPSLEPGQLHQLSQQEQQLFACISRHYLAQFYPARVVAKTQAELHCQTEVFIAKGRQLLEPGWQALLAAQTTHSTAEAKDAPLPPLIQGQVLAVLACELLDKKTEPPARFTEASLLSAMENISRFESRAEYKRILKDSSGLGTPATRHDAIKNAIDRGYLAKQGRQLNACARGHCLYELLPKVLRSPGLTASWEQKLKDIEQQTFTKEAFDDLLSQWVCRLVNQGKNDWPQLLSNYRSNPWVQAMLNAPVANAASKAQKNSKRRSLKSSAVSAPKKRSVRKARTGQARTSPKS